MTKTSLICILTVMLAVMMGAGGVSAETDLPPDDQTTGPWIEINEPEDQTSGAVITISGTTSLSAGDRILISITDTGISTSTTVVAGEGTGNNTWSANLSLDALSPGEYRILVSSSGTEATAGFRIIEEDGAGIQALAAASPGNYLVTLTADSRQVIHGSSFNVTIEGNANKLYFIYLEGASAQNINPTIQPDQEGMQGAPLNTTDESRLLVPEMSGLFSFTLDSAALNDTAAYFMTDGTGTRTIQYNTVAATAATYTIRVYEVQESSLQVQPLHVTDNTAAVRVTVSQGAVTIAASGNRSYYLGENVTFSGTNTDSEEVYLFITGPNLLTDGEALRTLPAHQSAYNSSPIAVHADNTWNWTWDSSNCGLDTGAYTIYATSRLTNGKSSVAFTKTNGDVAAKLSDSEYATISVNLNQPYLTGYVDKDGTNYIIHGVATGDPGQLRLYIFGQETFFTDNISVYENGTYEYHIGAETCRIPNDAAFVIEHPMYNNVIDVYITKELGNTSTVFSGDASEESDHIFSWIPFDTQNPSGIQQTSFIVWGNGKLRGFNAADALTEMIDDANIDDLYVKLSLTEPWIAISDPGTPVTGTTFLIAGTTNLAVNEQILVELTSPSSVSHSLIANVTAFSEYSRGWIAEVNASGFEPGAYTIQASCNGTTATAGFSLAAEPGTVTIQASGSHIYAYGEDITFTGTNTDSTSVYLFITGQGLMREGQVLYRLPFREPAYNATSSVRVTNNNWTYTWDSSNCGLDTGAYTIYATSRLTNGTSAVAGPGDAVGLPDSGYAGVVIFLKDPSLSAATLSHSRVAKGDKVYIRGTAKGGPTQLRIYIFGPNKFVTYPISVEDDGTYEYKLEVDSSWASNQYYIVIEHPMYNKLIDVYTTETLSNTSTGFSGDASDASGQVFLWIPFDTQTPSSWGYQASFIVWGNGKLQGSNAADALTKMIDDANIDDLYTKLTITVQEPWIRINNPGDQAVGTTFAVSGTTNLAVDDQILVEIVSSSFTAIDKTSTSTTSGYSQSTKVVAGDGTDNAWSVDVDSTNFKLDEYTIKASGIEADVTTTTNFNIVEQVVVTPTLPPDPSTPYNGSINLKSGWNFISVPKTLKTGNNTAASVFDGISMDNHSVLTYNAADASWTTLKGTDVVTPMTGFWIYSVEPETIVPVHPDNPSVSAPAVKPVYAGWNAIGLSAGEETRSGNALAGTGWRTLLPWNLESQTWSTAIIHNATGENSPDRYMHLGNGYWLYVDENGVLTGLTV